MKRFFQTLRKASRNEISQTIQFIVDQANSASEWTQEKVKLEHQITELEATITVLKETKLKLTQERDTASAEIERLKAELEVKKAEIVTKAGYLFHKINFWEFES